VTLKKVDSVYSLIGLRADKRYDPVRARLDISLDIDAAAQREIDRQRQAANHEPGKLDHVLQLAQALLTAQHYDEALQIVDTAIAREKASTNHKAFSDYEDYYVWILDTRSRVLQHLGRSDEALAQLIEASHLPENQSDNVSQVINLAGLYNDLGRPRDALAALEGLGASGASPYGNMQVANETLRSELQLGDSAAIDKQLAYLRDHSADALGTYQQALSNANRSDAAAEFLRSRLANVDQRAAALLDVQGYATGPLTPQVAQETQRFQAVLAREDVKQAIAKVGNVDSYKVLSPPF
jgi:hypothetical protein